MSIGTRPGTLAALLVLAALLGLAIGSFLNVVVYRLPRGMSLSHPPSACPSCGTPIKARHNVPVLGWLVLRGRCHACGARISPRYPLVEAATGVLFVLLAARRHGPGQLAALPAYLWFAAAALAVALIDVEVRRVPLRATGPSAALIAAYLVTVTAVAGEPGRLGRAGVAAAGFALATLALRRRPPGGLLALAAGVGLVLGWAGAVALLVGAFTAAVLVALALVRTRPAVLGAALCVAGLVGLLG